MWDQLKINYSVHVHYNEGKCHPCFYQVLNNKGGLCTEEEATSYFGFSYTGNTCQQDKLIVSFGLFMGFVDNKRNTEYHIVL